MSNENSADRKGAFEDALETIARELKNNKHTNKNGVHKTFAISGTHHYHVAAADLHRTSKTLRVAGIDFALAA